jgi:putative membrane protein
MIREFTFATIMCLGCSALAFAADNAGTATGVGNPAGATASAPQSPQPGMPAREVLNNDDRLFIREIAIGGRAEIDAGALAKQKGQNRSIVNFGTRMTIDHRKADQQLTDIAQAVGVTLPNQPDQEHRDMRTQLDQANGGAFDVAYIRGQITDHQKAVQLLEWEIGSGENARLKAFAAETLPVVMQHLEMANAILTQLTGAAPVGGLTEAIEMNPATAAPPSGNTVTSKP